MKRSPLPAVVKRNTLLLSTNQTVYTIVLQILVLLGAFMVIGLTGNVGLAGLATGLAWGGRLLVDYHSGRLMDILGRVKVLQVGTLIGLGIFIVVFGCSAATVASTALLSDLSGPSQRGRVIGLNDIVLGLGALLFPVIGGVVTASAGFQGLAWFGLLASVPAVVMALAMREPAKLSRG